ncbi:MAG TPA: TonB-dependent receptor [Candidatus Acidoferrales bacterium]|nr:TonB-dependent receptor [Candidatus Acidoferrales bacterium]
MKLNNFLRGLVFLCVSLCLSALVPLTLRAQQTLGSINGTVTDTSGAVVGKAQVQAKNVDTGLTVSANTQNDGSYNIVDLPIGTYTVTISKQGFKTEVHSNILVRGNLASTVNVTLQAGEVTTTITVSATPLMNQTDTTNGYTLGPEVIQTIPLGTGSFTQLAILAPGVNADLLGGSGTNTGLGNQDIFANGQRDTSNSFSFNSVNANNLFNGQSSSQVGEARYVLNTNEQFLAGGQIQTNTSVYDAIGEGLPTPPQETIEELHVNTSMYDASQGANSGAHVELTTKSGTNDLHGQLYEYHQTTGWNAAPFFFNAAGVDPNTGEPLLPRPALHRNTFGGTLGGPIIRDKLFFFGSYQGVRVTDASNGATAIVNVPSGLTNDRSAATLATLAGVPQGNIDNVALAVMQAKTPSGQYLIPSQNITNVSEISQLGGNAVEQGPSSTFHADQINANIDYEFSARDRMSGKYYYQRNPSTSPFAVSQVLGFPQTLHAGSQVLSLDNTTVVNANSTWEQRLGFIREIADAGTSQQLSPTTAGINLLGSNFFPGITISNAGSGTFDGLRIGPANNFANAGVFQNQFEGASNYDWVHGHHDLSFGGIFDYGQLNVINRENQVATFTFNNFANFLTGNLGGRSGGTILNGETNRYFRSRQAGLFAQDHWKLKSNLTVDLGLRWDWDGPLYEKNGLLTNFYPSSYSYDLASDTVNNIGLVIAGNNKEFCATKSSNCANNSTLTGRQWMFEPRLGLAWSPSFVKNVTVRAGYGIYADRGEFFTEFSPSAGLGISGPFGVTTEEPFTVPVHNSCTGVQCLQNNPFGTSPLPPPPNTLTGPNSVASLVHNQSGLSGCPEPVTPTCTPTSTPLFAFLFGGYDPKNTLPYSENWTLDVQWQPYNTLLFDIGYVGNHGQHELIPVPFNQPGIAIPGKPINGQTYSYGFQATDADGGFGALQTEQVMTTIGEFTGADGNTALRVPYIGYNPNSDYWEAEGVSNYNALQLNMTKRMSHGLQLNISYTWSHALDEGSGLAEGLFYNGNNPLDPRSGYGSAGYDRTHVLTINYVYNVPNLIKSEGFAAKALNDWGISGVTVAESGNPYSIYDFSGDVASQYFGAGDNFITNPLLTIINGSVHSVQLQGTTGVNPNNPVINGAAFGANLNAPGTNGVPPCGPTTDEPANPTAACDYSESGFATGNAPRNPFRGPFQTRFDFGVFKNIKINERFRLRYDAQFFNLFNHPSFDAPSNNFSLDGCFGPNIQSSPNNFLISNGFVCQWYGATAGVGSSGMIGNNMVPPGEGFIQNALGSPRFISMALHLTF